ncbi:hypothetical protein N802_08340 [Knoellia sinensis KCTC 19936]|uniref:DUF2617 domain-containing protein n=1 Tax=Knoellia sinensis KCTC 19936 TaxID=1385520 RepID=A0A0A0J8P4_9MICO|nr:DUF2617 family protein [Knoellia sinensis]KGN33805.1 hypothetical protein N802_08340 [Knoellia sinensis KCTC 19936]
MHHDLDLPYLDTRAEDLRWSLAHGELPAVATRRPVGLPLEMRILGASHQVVLDGPGMPALIETVAYVPGRGEPLPRPGVRTQVAGAPWVYELTTQVEELAAGPLRARVDALMEGLRGRPGALTACFPGDHHAVTALHAEPTPDGGARWTTWHVYPQHGQVVQTRTRVRPVGHEAHPNHPTHPEESS